MIHGRTLLAGSSVLLVAVLLSSPWNRAGGRAAIPPLDSSSGTSSTRDQLAAPSVESELALLAPDSSARVTLAIEERGPVTEGRESDLVLAGRVVLPHGTPSVERVVVVVQGAGQAEPLRVESDPRGSFRVRIVDSTRYVDVRLEADHLYLDRQLRVWPLELEEELVLEPRLGGRILGRVELAGEREHWRPEMVGARVELTTLETGTGVAEGREVRLDERLNFQWKGVPAGVELRISVHGSFFRASSGQRWYPEQVCLSPGKDLEIALELDPGAVIVGRIDWQTAGLSLEELAEVAIHVEPSQLEDGGMGYCWPRTLREQQRDRPDGRFRIGPLDRGPAVVRVVAPGCVPLEFELEQLSEQEERNLGTITLQRGATLSGRVVMEDGSPADCAVVLVDDPTSPPRPGTVPECYRHGSHSGRRIGIPSAPALVAG